MNSLKTVLEAIGIPVAYGRFKEKKKPPYLLWLGAGQDVMPADDTFVWTQNAFSVEYYFTKKDENMESTIEETLLDGGFRYQKSEDSYIESEDIFVIYYSVE